MPRTRYNIVPDKIICDKYGNVLVLFHCANCHENKPANEVGVRKQVNGTVIEQSYCAKCRGNPNKYREKKNCRRCK